MSPVQWEQDLGLRELDFHERWQEASGTGLQVYARGLMAWFSCHLLLPGDP